MASPRPSLEGDRNGKRPCPATAGFNFLPLAAEPPFLARQESLARRPPLRCGPSAIARGAGPVRPPSFVACEGREGRGQRSEEHTSELQSLMRHSYAVFCLQKKNKKK